MRNPVRSLFVGALALLALGAAAFAIQPGTSGTEKRFQEQAFRSAVLIQKNNTATGTGTGSTGVATLNAAGSGIITTASIVTPADSDYALTLTNSMIEAGDIVLATVAKGTATVGKPYIAEITPGASSVVITIRNASGATTLNGTLKVGFVVVKQSANGSD